MRGYFTMNKRKVVVILFSLLVIFEIPVRSQDINELAKKGELGTKTGKGFYDYKK